MSIKTFDNLTDFGRAISESPLQELRFVGKVMTEFLNLTRILTLTWVGSNYQLGVLCENHVSMEFWTTMEIRCLKENLSG